MNNFMNNFSSWQFMAEKAVVELYMQVSVLAIFYMSFCVILRATKQQIIEYTKRSGLYRLLCGC